MEKGLMPLKNVAKKYKLPSDWLESESRNGGLSCLIAGKQILFDEETLVKELVQKVGRTDINKRNSRCRITQR